MKKFIIVVVTLSVTLVFLFVAMFAAIFGMAKQSAIDGAEYCSDRINDKVEETLDLLTSLSKMPGIQGDNLTYREKSAELTKISQQFGYMMIRILDKNLFVYSETATTEDGKSSDLSRRDYLQAVKSTLQPQVTDAFVAGADGKTVNFTIAVPIVKDGVFNGALFAAIYETDFATMLKDNSAVLLGKQLQYMSGVDVDDVGVLLDSELGNAFLFGTSTEQRMVEIRSDDIPESHFAGMRGLVMEVYAFKKVAHTNWNVFCTVSFFHIIGEHPLMFTMLTLSLAATLFLLIAAIYNRNRFLSSPSEQ